MDNVFLTGTASDVGTSVVSVEVATLSLAANSTSPTWSFANVPLPLNQGTTFNVTATDEAGNVGWQVVTLIQGGIAPRLVCPPDQVIECGISAPTASGVQLLNCQSTVIRTDSFVTTCGSSGILFRTFTAPACLPQPPAACLQQIQFLDRTPPLLICPASLTLPCSKDIANTPLGSATLGAEACGTATMTLTSSAATLGCGLSTTQTFEAVDSCSNRATCTQSITVYKPFLPHLSFLSFP